MTKNKVTLELSSEELQVVLDSLAGRPYSAVATVIANIVRQVQPSANTDGTPGPASV